MRSIGRETDPGAAALDATGPSGGGLVAEAVTKTFGSTVALNGMSATFGRGVVHGLIGENGSGKSTFVKIVAGIHRADAGLVGFDGVPLTGSAGADSAGAAGSPDNAGGPENAARIACVYQDGSLIDELTVAQNLDLIVEPEFRPETGGEPWQRAVLDAAGLGDVGLDSRTGDLPGNEQRLVEIAAVLARRPDVILFDESTSTLDETGVAWVLESMRAAAARGACVIFVTHRLHEVLAVTSHIAILRDGVLVAELPTAGASTEELVRHMAGREVTAFTRRAAVRDAGTPVALRSAGLRAASCGPIDLAVRRGEIVGIGGAAGNGQAELIRALAGDGLDGGEVTVGGVPLRRAEDAADAGAVFVSSDRRAESLSSLLSIRENYTLALEASAGRWWRWLRRRREVARATELADAYDLARGSIEQPVATLSGGNQQKVAVGRAVAREPKVLLIEEPTEGVDVRSRFDIYRSLVAVAEQGTAVVFTSSDAGELRLLADRVVVLARGRSVAELHGEEVTEEAIVHAFTTAKERQEEREHRAEPEPGDRRDRAPRHAERPTRRPGQQPRPQPGQQPIRRPGRRSTLTPATFGLLAVLLAVLWIYGTYRDPNFGTVGNLGAILQLSLPLALAALAQLPVLLVAEIDASIGSMMGLIVVLLSFFPATSPPLLIGLAIAAGVLLGAVNALLVVRLRVTAVIATIATLGIFLGVGRILRPEPSGLINNELAVLLGQGVAHIPGLFLVVLVLAILLDFWVNRTRAGLRSRAVGYSAVRAAQLGVRTARFRAAMFVVAGALAGLGAVALAAQTGVGDPGSGSGYTLLSIAVPVIGGALLAGGRGSAIGCVLAALFVAEVQDFIPFVDVPTGGYLIAVGVLTIVALIISTVRPSAAIGSLSRLITKESRNNA
ncbi:ATP-binding cassette domain-containing protein [Thermopolyspora sp. NPDC052614]|uniref:ATP-binding cassette domain-containing protein n=1 Tax=Thermopolyspora sp. NPDC052614 TaxID=3155682 RepID=UPI0034254E58